MKDLFQIVRKLNVLNFNENSELHSIEKDAFFESSIQFLIVPLKVNHIGRNAFWKSLNLVHVEFLSEELIVDSFCFSHCEKLCIASFPNINNLTIGKNAFSGVPTSFSLFIKSKIKIVCD